MIITQVKHGTSVTWAARLLVQCDDNQKYLISSYTIGYTYLLVLSENHVYQTNKFWMLEDILVVHKQNIDIYQNKYLQS